jgi:D-alanyl-D-alanine carboxypeptidase (penicillin-binding protein 5/6)
MSKKSKKKSKKKSALKYKDVINYLDKNLMYFSMLAFVLISTTTLLTLKLVQPKEQDQDLRVFSTKIYPPIPTIKDTASFPIISAQGALAVDLVTMMPLYEKNPDEKYLPASTTKIVTALVAMENYNNSDVFVVNGKRVSGQNMGLVTGEKITVESLLEGLLIFSANDAAEVLAVNYPGGRDEFIAEMNNKAFELGLINTSFENPTGFDGGEHFTTSRDLIRVGIVAMDIAEFAEIVSQKEKTVESVDKVYVHKLTNTNKLLGQDGVKGIKTGWTENARENLVTYIEKDNKKIMIAILGSQDRFGETKEIIDWIMDHYEWEDVVYEENNSY